MKCKYAKKKFFSPEENTVFLGGSCNPTTWRKDIAIPELEKRHISYFNPVSISITKKILRYSQGIPVINNLTV